MFKSREGIFVSLFLVLFISFSLVACDEGSNSNGNGNGDGLPNKIEIEKSSVELDGDLSTIEKISMEEIDEVTFFILVFEDNTSGNRAEGDTVDSLAFSLTEDFDVDGKTIILFKGGELFTGANFSVQEEEDSVELSGTLVSVDDKNVTIETKVKAIKAQAIAGDSELEVHGTNAVLNGDLGARTFNQIIDLVKQHPEVDTIILEEVPGSVNDEVNVEAGRIIRKSGLATFVPADGLIASGGVDLFVSGVSRTIEDGAMVGVHSCFGDGVECRDIPKGDSRHDSQIDYFNEMLGEPLGENFYFYTLDAAPFDDVHYMTRQEIDMWKLEAN